MGKQTIEELEAQVKQLAAERDAVVAENVMLKSAFDKPQAYLSWHAIPPTWEDPLPCGEYLDVHETDGHKNSDGTDCWPVYAKPEIETPSTDAFLASLRAEAIEFAAYHLPNNGKYEDMILTLADEVREGLTKVKIPAPKYERSQSEQVKGVQS